METNGETSARLAGLERLLLDAYRWVLSEHVDGLDGACEQCMGAPTGDDYVCVPHRARAALPDHESWLLPGESVDAEIDRLTRERDDARADADEYSQTVDRLSELLRGVANALKGPPEPLELHDWSDLPEVAARVVSERDEARETVTANVDDMAELVRQRDEARAELARVGLAVGGAVYRVPDQYERVTPEMLQNMAAFPGLGWHVSRVSAVARELQEARAEAAAFESCNRARQAAEAEVERLREGLHEAYARSSQWLAGVDPGPHIARLRVDIRKLLEADRG